jgi:hypothetical protein
MDLVSTQPLIEMSIRNLPVGKRQPEHKADILTSEPIAYKMWQIRHLTAQWASTTRYKNIFYLFSSTLLIEIQFRLILVQTLENSRR